MFLTMFLFVLDIPCPTRDINQYSVPDMFPTMFLLVMDILHPTHDINRYSVPDMFLTSMFLLVLDIPCPTCDISQYSIPDMFPTCSRQAPDNVSSSHALHMTLPDPDKVPLKVIPVRQDNIWGNHQGMSGLRVSGGLHYSNLKGLLVTFRQGSSIYWNLFQPTTKSWWGEKKLILGRHMFIYGRKYSFPHLGISAFFRTETPVPLT